MYAHFSGINPFSESRRRRVKYLAPRSRNDRVAREAGRPRRRTTLNRLVSPVTTTAVEINYETRTRETFACRFQDVWTTRVYSKRRIRCARCSCDDRRRSPFLNSCDPRTRRTEITVFPLFPPPILDRVSCFITLF